MCLSPGQMYCGKQKKGSPTSLSPYSDNLFSELRLTGIGQVKTRHQITSVPQVMLLDNRPAESKERGPGGVERKWPLK